jgi:abortive infection bacteriophage resistance protein
MEDPKKAEDLLTYVNYYKLRAYFIPFDEGGRSGDHKFKAGTNFQDVFRLYRFDRKLRILVNDMLERFELAVRTRWAFELSQAKGGQAHEDVANFSRPDLHRRSLENLKEQYEKSKEQFAEHHKKTYPSLFTPPVWVSVELLSFGDVSFWLRNTKSQGIKRRVSSSFGDFEPIFFEDFVKQASMVRNMCSHHSRLWNRVLPFAPRRIRRSRFDQSLLNRGSGSDSKLYNFLAILAFIGDEISPGHSWSDRLVEFLEKDESRLTQMGFPKDWRRAFP